MSTHVPGFQSLFLVFLLEGVVKGVAPVAE